MSVRPAAAQVEGRMRPAAQATSKPVAQATSSIGFLERGLDIFCFRGGPSHVHPHEASARLHDRNGDWCKLVRHGYTAT